MPNHLPPGVLPGQLSLGEDFGGTEVPASPDSPSSSDLATKEEGGHRCQVCDFPIVSGLVQGEVEGERYKLLICQSCLEYAVLCLRDSYRQCRLFDDDFEIAELCDFGKVNKQESWQEENRKAIDAYNKHVEAHGVFATDEEKAWEQMRPVGKEFGSDEDEAQQAREILERVTKGEEQTFSSEELRKDLGLKNDD
ncbi:type II toxin-antitoxin system CcdA family antitoxin [Pseudomonas sp. UL073]|uniref:Type II toxin-antitoxin system CcdA family antitoxin n=1 Tax=Zestomonas insulae TaxID=2809017 RepID=A0ABS2IAZ2_9GAMM|nr:type II toxin-antitoxin system CcdA family antitoxin [Pseudomonas insulae]MBM7059333.1 type II toxin-antitoxin system CcdA family antitoxin [Pseudomonas insulae]